MDAEELLERYAKGERNFQRQKLSGENLKSANLSGIDLYCADLSGTELNDATLTKAKLNNANLSRASLSTANLSQVEIISANLSYADLSGTNLSNANLSSSNLSNVNLDRGNLNEANLSSANLTGCSLVDLTGARMPHGKVYNQEAFKEEISKLLISQENSGTGTSMTRQVIRTDAAPAPVGPYNQAIVASGQMVFVAGQIAIDPRVGHVVYTEDVAKQTECVMSNIEAILKAAGANWSNVVKTTVFLSDMNNFTAMNAVYAKYFDEATAPARATVEVSRLPKDVLVEIDCIAVI